MYSIGRIFIAHHFIYYSYGVCARACGSVLVLLKNSIPECHAKTGCRNDCRRNCRPIASPTRTHTLSLVHVCVIGFGSAGLIITHSHQLGLCETRIILSHLDTNRVTAGRVCDYEIVFGEERSGWNATHARRKHFACRHAMDSFGGKLARFRNAVGDGHLVRMYTQRNVGARMRRPKNILESCYTFVAGWWNICMPPRRSAETRDSAGWCDETHLPGGYTLQMRIALILKNVCIVSLHQMNA